MKMNLKLSLIFCALFSFGAFASNKIPTAACPTIAVSGTNVNCYGDNNGTAQVAISNGSGNYNISWSNGANTTGINGLAVGTYTVTVLDNTSGCTVTGAYVVGSPDPISVSETITNVNCFGDNTGSIQITTIGGNGSYTFEWRNSVNSLVSTNEDLTGAPSGEYTLYVTDFRNCTFSKVFNITQPAEPLSSSSIVTDASCFSTATGAINIEVWGGTPSYTYLWNTGHSTQDVSGLTAGGYTVTVTDFKGCDITVPFTINQPNNLTVSTSHTDVLCYGESTGTLTAVPSGGTTPYSYSWQNSNTLYAANTDNLINVVADNYQVTVTDDKGCEVVGLETVNQPAELKLTNTFLDVSCYGESTGNIDLTVQGGMPNYTYAWTNSMGTSYGSNQDLVGVPAETYTVLVTDNNNCTETLVQEIIQPLSPIQVVETVEHVKCHGDNSGKITLDVTGGSPSYTYSWATGQTTSEITGLTAQTYVYSILDSKMCGYSSSIVISEPAQPVTVTNVITDVNCFGESNGSIDLTVSGGTSPYTYEWENSTFVLSDVNQDLINYVADEYTYTVTDSNNCVETGTLVINEPPLLESSITGVNILCKGGNNGSIDLTVTGGSTPYSYSWNNGPVTEDQSDLVAGYYEVQVTDYHNCSLTNAITLTEPSDSLDFTFEVSDVKCNDGEDGEIELTVEGGTFPYYYLWSNGDTLHNVENLTSGFYQFTVTDENGCILIDSIFVDQPLPLSINESVTVVTCNGFSDGIIDITPTGGTMPYSYTWFNSDYALSSQEEDLINFPADVYQLEVIDSNDCFYERFVEIQEPEPLIIDFTSNVVSCFDGSDGNIYVDITGGNPGYNTNWSNGSTTEDLLSIPFGVYTLVVTDQKSCEDSITVDISQPEPMTVTFDVEEVTCIDQHDGIAYAFPSGGNGGYLYAWSNGDNTYTASGLSNLTYSVTVVDILGCTGTGEVFIPRSNIGCIDPVTAFTPNGDNYNDSWVIDNMYLYPEATLQIFNKWGNLVYKTNGVYEPWDGVVNGADMPSGTYYYIIDLKTEDRDPLTGNISIVR